MDIERFEAACAKAAERERAGIGTMGENGIHSALKHYYEPDTSRHEVPVGGYIADIAGERGIIEIQTRSFSSIREKISRFLETGDVTIVYPCVTTKRIITLSPDTGEVISSRISPRHGSLCDLLHELRGLKDTVRSERLTIKAAMLEANEYRTAPRRRRCSPSERPERMPTAFIEEIVFASPDDYRRFIPGTLPESFTSQGFADAAGIKLREAQDTLNVMTRLGLTERIGKEGRSYIYRLSSE